MRKNSCGGFATFTIVVREFVSTLLNWAKCLTEQLPGRLRIQLRANRQDSTLPDSHGQVWMELVALAGADNTLFQGTTGPIQDEMLQTLGLSGRVQFPIRRLVTLWKNNNWQQMITSWCRASIGRALFNVSLWEEMARYRIDDVSNPS